MHTNDNMPIVLCLVNKIDELTDESSVSSFEFLQIPYVIKELIL